MNTPAFKTVTFPLMENLEIQIGKNFLGYFYEVLDMSRRVVDVKDNLTEGLLFEAVGSVLNPSNKNQLLTLLKTL